MWLDWKFSIGAYFGLLACLEHLQANELETNPVTMISLATDTLKVEARQTYFFLATSTSDAALHIVLSIADRCGFEAW